MAEISVKGDTGWSINLAMKMLKLPRGVKFEPSDEDIIWHLLAEIREGDAKPHPFIGLFIKFWNIDRPHKLPPGVKKDGSTSYFSHKPFVPQEIQSRKRNEGMNDGCDNGFWRKFGNTKPVYVDGTQKGSKEIFVLCKYLKRRSRLKKTNWVIHQYHIGTGDVKGNLVISKVFYQLSSDQGEKNAPNLCMSMETVSNFATNGRQVHAYGSCMKSLAVPNQNVTMGNHHNEANASQGDVSHAMVEPSNCMQNIPIEEAHSIPAAVSESGNDEVDDMTLQERYRLLFSNIEKVEHEALQGQCKSMLCNMNDDIGQQLIYELNQDTGFGVHVEENEVQMVDRQKSCEDISMTQNSSSLPNINCIKESSVRMAKDEVNGDRFLHYDAISIKGAVGHHDLSVAYCTNESYETGAEEYHDQDAAQVKAMMPTEKVVIDTIKQDNYQMHDIFDHPDMNVYTSSLRDACLPLDTNLEAPSLGVSQVEHLLKCDNSSQPSDMTTLSIKTEPSDEWNRNSITVKNSSQPSDNSSQPSDNSSQPSDMMTLSIKTEPSDEWNRNSITVKNVNEPFNTIHKLDMISHAEIHNSILPIKPKLEPMKINPLLSSEIKIEKHTMENKSDDELDFLDDISLAERKQMLNSTSFTNMEVDVNAINPLQTILPPECDAPNGADAKSRNSSSKRKRKKTATDSVEVALEEDAPGLLQMLLEKGITANEIKLYGEEESEEAISIGSTDDSFQHFEAILAKLFPEVPSILKFPSVRKTRASKVLYCVACLLSLIEQARYLHFRKSPVEWGWCRDLQSFIFVFESHNRLVLERPEYGYATYFFELVDSLTVDWQIKRLVTAMKLPCCTRTVLLENKPLIVGEDMTEGEAQVMEEFGWIRNTGLGTMLRFCDRVVHDKKSEKYSLEWNAKIGKLLMDGRYSGRTVLCNMPKRFRVETEDIEVKQEPY